MADGIERDLGYFKGARFFREGGAVMFQFGIDPNNVIGPRLATRRDKLDFPGSWEAFQAEENPENQAPLLDGDGDGKVGGSLPVKRGPGRPPKTDRLR